MVGFLLRFLALEAVAAIGAVVSTAVAHAMRNATGGTDPARLVPWVAVIAVLSIPGSVLLAIAAQEPEEIAVAAVFTLGVLCLCGYLAGSTSSSTAALIFLWVPLTGIGGGVVAVFLRAWFERTQ